MELQGLLCKNVFINCRSCANPTANSQTGRHENRRGSTAHLAAASWKPTCPSSSSPSPSSVRSYPHSPVAAREQSCRRSPKTAMAESSTPADGVVAEEARQQEAGQGNSEDSHGLQDTKEQEVRKGKTALASTELMREDLVQSAVSFLKHPKVAASSDGQRRSFLENKGLTVDEIDEAFRRLQSPSSDSASLNTCTSQGVSDHSCRITQQETKVGTKCMDGSERVEPGTEPAVPRHPKSYMEIMEMIQRGERPDDIQDINDDPPNPDQPISEPRMAPKPKPWEKQDQGSLAWDLKPPLGDSSIPRAEAQYDGGTSSKPTDSVDASKQEDPVAQAEVAVRSKSTTDHTASSLE